MELSDTNMWMIRAERSGFLIHHFINKGIASLGWGKVGPINPTDTNAAVRRRLDEAYPNENIGARPNIVGMLRRFSCEVRVGDVFVTYDPQYRQYHIGIVRSGAEIGIHPWMDLATGDEFEELGYVRRTDWVNAIPRDALTATARNALNPQLSHYRISDAASAEIRRLCS